MEVSATDENKLKNLIQFGNFDYIIIGAGAAGSVVAARLILGNLKNRVLVIEMGRCDTSNPLILTPGVHESLWNHPTLSVERNPTLGFYKTVNQMGKKYDYPRGITCGGSTAHHSLITNLGSPVIYDEISNRLKDPRFSYKNLLLYVKKMEHYNIPVEKIDSQYHGSTGWLKIKRPTYFPEIQRAFAQSAQLVTGAPFIKDIDGNPSNRAGIAEGNIAIDEKGERCFSYKDLLIPTLKWVQSLWNTEIEIFPRLVILYNATVIQIQFENQKDQKPAAVGIHIVVGENIYEADCGFASGDTNRFDQKIKQLEVELQSMSCSNFLDKKEEEEETEVKKNNTTYFIPCSQEIILSAGAIETPHLLMLSGIGSKEHLEQNQISVIINNEHVGSHLQDHQECGINFEVDANKFIWGNQAATLLDNISAALQDLKPEVETEGGNVHAKNLISEKSDQNKKKILTIEEKTKLKEKIPLLQKFANEIEKKEGPSFVIFDWHSELNKKQNIPMNQPDLHFTSTFGFFSDFNYKCRDILPNNEFRETYFRSQFDPYHPKFFKVYHRFLLENLKITQANGTIRLASQNPLQSPLIDLRLYEDEDANERLAYGVLLIRKIANTPPLSDFYIKNKQNFVEDVLPGSQYQSIEELKLYMKKFSAFGHHISGTARLGISPETGVCDRNFKVFGIEKLRIVDASVFPTGLLSAFNPSEAIYLLAELASDIILGKNI